MPWLPAVGLIPLAQIAGVPEPWQQLKGNAYYIRRFDRGAKGARIHIEDFDEIYGQFPEAKYKNYSYTNMAADIWRLTDEDQFKEFIRRLILAVVIGNNDMHLKNWSLIYRDGRTPQLAPAYDYVFTVRYIADDKLALQTARETAEKIMALWPTFQNNFPVDQETQRRVTAHMKSIPFLNQ